MKNRIKKTFYSLLLLFSICFIGLAVFMLNPQLSYSCQTNYKDITVFHNKRLDSTLFKIIDTSLVVIQNTLLYEADFKSELCLNDGSIYPNVIRKVLGNDVLRAFSNKLVDLSKSGDEASKIIAWEQELELQQFLTHGFIHNLQYQHHGFFDANPLGKHPNWKWEGYVEYELFGKIRDLKEIIKLLENENQDDYSWIDLGNNKKTLKLHIRYLAMTKYCFDVLKMDYETFMKDDRSEEAILNELTRNKF